ncbi:Intradiol ring-cleavage dioxygenase [Hyaloraphidium curvatum]|nr:Intradiol ring-cleavage dioxygenase [Hyaloraphidium curvatum]
MAAPNGTPLTLATMTEHVLAATTQGIPPGPNAARTKEVLTSLITHLHDFARETNLTTEEWELGIDFLTRVGQKCDDKRQEFILLSDVLGMSSVVDGLNNPVPSPEQKMQATESTVLGPFWWEHSPEVAAGGSISAGGEEEGEPLLVRGHVYDTDGNPVEAILDVWETDAHGQYDVQYSSPNPNHRGRIRSSPADGSFLFTAILPITYPIPTDGPVGELLRATGRHPMRPSHMHFMITPAGKGARKLVTSIYDSRDPHVLSDTVFGVKSSLIATYRKLAADDPDAAKVGFKGGEWLLEWDFVLGKK